MSTILKPLNIKINLVVNQSIIEVIIIYKGLLILT